MDQNRDISFKEQNNVFFGSYNYVGMIFKTYNMMLAGIIVFLLILALWCKMRVEFSDIKKKRITCVYCYDSILAEVDSTVFV